MMPERDCEDFDDHWWRCMEVIESAHDVMGLVTPDEQEMIDKWTGEESEDCLLGKCESWKEVRKHLWEHYVSDVEKNNDYCWESDDD